MKQYILPLFALTATAMLLPSCSSDDIDIQTGDATVTLSATLPESLQTRSFGDGHTAKHLQMVVLDGDTKLPVFAGDADVLDTSIDMTANVDVKLVTGKTYTVVCWADAAEGSPYTFHSDTYTITADYSKSTVNDDKLDAFYAAETFKVEGNGTRVIKLTRPFAQLNIGTDDLTEAAASGFTATTAQVTVPVSTELNLRSGEVNAPVKTTFKAHELPGDDETFPESAGPAYKYLTMNYVLTGTDKTLEDVVLKVSSSKRNITRTFNTVPVQRNYRTNIYGSLLTNEVDVHVVIEPNFDDFYNYAVATTADEIAANLSAGKDVLVTSSFAPNKMMTVSGGGNVTLNLGGKSLVNTEQIADLTTEPKTIAMLSVADGTTLTINGNGTMKMKEEDCYLINVKDGSHLIIEDGNFSGCTSTVQVQEGTLEINGGTFDLVTKYQDKSTYLLNCIDSNYKNGTAKIIVRGGKFIGFNPADNAAEGAHTNFVAPGYVSVKTSNSPETYEVMESGKAMNAIIANPVDYIIPVVDTFLSPSKTSTLTLAAGGEIKGGFSEKEVNETIFVGKGTLTINGEGGRVSARTIPSKWTAAVNVQGGKLVINGNNTFDGGSGSLANNAVKIINGTLTINGGYFHSGLDAIGGTNDVILLAPFSKMQSAKCYINGGVFECDGDAKYLINMKDDARKWCTVEITGGTFVGFDPSNVDEGDITSFVKDGYKSVETTWNGKQAWQVVKQ